VTSDELPILVADDDPATQRLIDALLRRRGFATVFAADGDQAIELLRVRRFAAIVLGMMMPRAGGRDVIEFLAKQKMRVPVVVCTAAPPRMTANLDPNIVKAVIRKPFDIDDFAAAVTAAASAGSRTTRVLIVDDDTRDRYVLRTFIAPAETLEAETGEAALDIIHENPPDLVLLDLMLPGVQGEDILRRLRERAETTNVPVVVVTSKLLADEQRRELLQYAAGVIYKGDLSRDTLHEAVSHAVTARSAWQPPGPPASSPGA
jgi:CheY-like chemotaxis protein